jgi:hypothetical protein
MNRTVVAFLIAPLSGPAVVACLAIAGVVSDSYQPIHNPHLHDGILIAMPFALVISYSGAIIFGIPGYLWLRRRGIDAFWAWAALGYGGGAAIGLALPVSILVNLMIDCTASDSPSWRALPEMALEGLTLIAPFGALVATALRLVGGPRKMQLP